MRSPSLCPLHCYSSSSILAIVIAVFGGTLVTIASCADVAHSSDVQTGDTWRDLSAEIQEEINRYEPEFIGADRGIIGRAEVGTTALTNNYPINLNINQGDTNYWVFTNASVLGNHSATPSGLPSPVLRREGNIEGIFEDDEGHDLEHSGELATGLKKRQDLGLRTVYVSLTACLQPQSNDTRSANSPPPQLELYYSTSPNNPRPGPGGTISQQTQVQVVEGYASFNVSVSAGDIFIGVHAPTNSQYIGSYNYDIAASIDSYFHSLNSSAPNLLFIDSDNSHALLITDNLTELAPSDPIYKKWVNINPLPFSLFAHNMNDSSIKGLTNSYCGLANHAQIAGYHSDGQRSTNVDMNITTRGLANKPKQQFFLKGLNGSSTYYGFLAMFGNSTAGGASVVGGGGKVWQMMNFTTKADGNCQVLFNLTFCSEVAYAVPANPSTFPDINKLTQFYDNNTLSLYQNFTNSLAQIACNTTSSAQYSLVKTCDDCAAAYKEWLCAVTIPRCDDFSSDKAFLQPRNVAQKFLNNTQLDKGLLQDGQTMLQRAYANSSRFLAIDSVVQPGPYKEVLPCADLCYTLVQSCPASLQFQCPDLARGGNFSYGQRSDDGSITCSFLGAAYYLSNAPPISPPITWILLAVLAISLSLGV